MVYFIQSSQKSYNNKYNIKHMKEQVFYIMRVGVGLGWVGVSAPKLMFPHFN